MRNAHSTNLYTFLSHQMLGLESTMLPKIRRHLQRCKRERGGGEDRVNHEDTSSRMVYIYEQRKRRCTTLIEEAGFYTVGARFILLHDCLIQKSESNQREEGRYLSHDNLIYPTVSKSSSLLLYPVRYVERHLFIRQRYSCRTQTSYHLAFLFPTSHRESLNRPALP